MTTMEHATETTAQPPPAIQQRLPRDVSPSVRWSLRIGGALNTVGWALLGFGMIFFWIFAMNADVPSLWQFNGEAVRAPGQVTGSHKTSFTVGGSKHRRGKPVYANEYVFIAADGAEFSGVSYATNISMNPGRAVQVEHPVGRPDLSRIVGMRRAVLSGWAGLVALLPAAGLALIVAGFRKGGRNADLLENGRLAWGTMISKEATNARVNKQPVFKLTFEFTAENRRAYHVVTKTHVTEELEDEDHELILYEPRDPNTAVVADSLPAGIRVDEKGQVHQKPSVLAWLLLPTLALVGHGTYFCTTYLQ